MEKINIYNICNEYIKNQTKNHYFSIPYDNKVNLVTNVKELDNDLKINSITIMPVIIKKEIDYEYNDLLIISNTHEQLSSIYDILTNDEYFDLDPDRLIFHLDELLYNSSNALLQEVRNKKNFILKKNLANTVIYYDRGEKYGNVLDKHKIEPNQRYIVLGETNQDLVYLYLNKISIAMNKIDDTYQSEIYAHLITKLESICQRPYLGQKEIRRIVKNIKILPFLISMDYEEEGDLLIKQALKDGIGLCINHPFLQELINTSIDDFKKIYPLIKINNTKIKHKINNIEAKSQKNILEALAEIKAQKNKKILDKATLFTLYNKHDMPIELIYECAKENNIIVNIDEFNRLKNIKNNYEDINLFAPEIASFKTQDTFVGYDKLGLETKVIAIFKDNKKVNELESEGYIILEENPFYVSNGTQESDTGYIKNDHVKIEVLDVIKSINNQSIIKIRILEGTLYNKDTVLTHVLNSKRKNINKNHTALHLLEHVITTMLGNSITSKMTKATPKTFRYDFEYKGKLSDEIIIKIEQRINEEIKKGYDIKRTIINQKELPKLKNLHKDGSYTTDEVKLITIGDTNIICDGTFVNNTSEISKVALSLVENKGLNTYRIEGAVDNNIYPILFSKIKPYNSEMLKLLSKAKTILDKAKLMNIKLDYSINIDNSKPTSYADIVFNKNELSLVQEKTSLLEKSFFLAQKENALNNIDLFLNEKVTYKDLNIIIAITEGYDKEILRIIIDALANRLDNYFILLANVDNSSVNFLCSTNSTSELIHCGEIVNSVSIKTGGNGNGSKYFAQGGGKDITNLVKELELIKKRILSI